ncbi:hypothetical protein F0L68_00655 [Solihabitans fulvus]|uniref:Uncharacterized protein n=1 Tax=Solihabitans fulvus TaxID=1892852 RepID=A0A5B2XUA0_9PSEU|nr:hypothetical protein [Solihabitans fulvus]KAA2267076.1 hypothetical protein F0L68_00655 [Solihabitans fulvus]
MTIRKPRRPAGTTASEPAVERIRARITFMQHEYLAIRAELLAALSNQQTILAYGLAATAVIYTGVLTNWSNLQLRTGILSLAPLLLMFVWFVWYGEVQRLLRARWFLWQLEKKINAQLRVPRAPSGESELPSADTLHWESWVRGRNVWRKNLHSRPAYHLATGLLCGTGLGTTALSVVLGLTAPQLSGPLRALVLCGAAGFLVLLGYAAFLVGHNDLLKGAGKPTP